MPKTKNDYINEGNMYVRGYYAVLKNTDYKDQVMIWKKWLLFNN